MIIYNVTLSINPAIETEVLQWLREEHIPEVMETGLFISHDMYKIVEDHISRTSNSYAVQYKLETWKHFEIYTLECSEGLKQKTQDKFGENVLAFRTFLEKI